jgi:rhodanese-related sulfurtransferase/DNA-directed RNA polymerase subunit RPC12/RpoP
MKKSFTTICLLLILFTILTAENCINQQQAEVKEPAGKYVCLPCGSPCDTAEYNETGTCSHCNMQLVKKSTIKHTNVEPEDLCSLVSKAGAENVLLLDVRTVPEFEGKAEQKFGRLKNAVNIPVQELEQRMNELSDWKNKKIIVYCSHSHRSPRASYILTQKGFKNVFNLQGGMSVWKTRVSDEKCNTDVYITQ